MSDVPRTNYLDETVVPISDLIVTRFDDRFEDATTYKIDEGRGLDFRLTSDGTRLLWTKTPVETE